MNETLRKLLARLGVTVPENADITDEQASAALSALDALETDAGKSGVVIRRTGKGTESRR